MRAGGGREGARDQEDEGQHRQEALHAEDPPGEGAHAQNCEVQREEVMVQRRVRDLVPGFHRVVGVAFPHRRDAVTRDGGRVDADGIRFIHRERLGEGERDDDAVEDERPQQHNGSEPVNRWGA